MNCNKTLRLMTEYLAEEISEQKKAALLAHLEACAECRNEFESMQKDWQTIGKTLKNTDAPESLSIESRNLILDSIPKKSPPKKIFLRYAAEILVVCAILGIISGMFLPALNSSRKKARAISAKAELEQAITIDSEVQRQDDALAADKDALSFVAPVAAPSAPLVAGDSSVECNYDSERGKVAKSTVERSMREVRVVSASEEASGAPGKYKRESNEMPPHPSIADGSNRSVLSPQYRERDMASTALPKKEYAENAPPSRKSIIGKRTNSKADLSVVSSESISEPSAYISTTVRLNLKTWNLTSESEVKEWLKKHGISGVGKIAIDRAGNRLSVEIPSHSLEKFQQVVRKLTAQEQKLKELSQGLPFYPAALRPISTFSVNTNTASYTRARQAVMSGRQPNPEEIHAEDFINYFDYHYPSPRNGVFDIMTEAAANPFRPANVTMRIALQGKKLGPDRNTPSNYTVLLDASGSMALENHLGIAVKAVTKLVEKLNPHDSIRLIVCREKPVTIFGAKKIIPEVHQLRAFGKADIAAGIAAAYEAARQNLTKGAQNRIVLITDGIHSLPGHRYSAMIQMVKEGRAEGISTIVLGFGEGGDDTLLDAIAENGDGSYVFMDDAAEVEKLFSEHFEARFRPIAEDVKIQVEFNPETVREYRQIGYSRRQLSSEDFRDDKVNAGEVGSGQSVTALYELRLVSGCNPDAIAAIVRLRYKNLDNARIEERQFHIYAGDIKKDWNTATPQLQLALLAAEFAETLRYPDTPGIANPRGILNRLNILQRNPGGLSAQLPELTEFLKRCRQ